MIYGVTFGSAHQPGPDKFVEVEAPNEMAARRKIISIFDRKWAFIYDPDEFSGMPEKYGLTKYGDTIQG